MRSVSTALNIVTHHSSTRVSWCGISASIHYHRGCTVSLYEWTATRPAFLLSGPHSFSPLKTIKDVQGSYGRPCCFRTPNLTPFAPASRYCWFSLKKTVYSLYSSRCEMVLLTSVLEETTAGRNTGHFFLLSFVLCSCLKYDLVNLLATGFEQQTL